MGADPIADAMLDGPQVEFHVAEGALDGPERLVAVHDVFGGQGVIVAADHELAVALLLGGDLVAVEGAGAPWGSG